MAATAQEERLAFASLDRVALGVDEGRVTFDLV